MCPHSTGQHALLLPQFNCSAAKLAVPPVCSSLALLAGLLSWLDNSFAAVSAPVTKQLQCDAEGLFTRHTTVMPKVEPFESHS